MASVLVFDINETTLDLAPVRDVIDAELGSDQGFALWFGRLLQTSMAVTATDRFQDFGVLAQAALDSVAQSLQQTLADGAWERVGAAMGSLLPHPDVEAGLQALADNGWRLVALTNSAQHSVDAQLTGAGIHDRFEKVLSVDSVRAFKPAGAPYQLALSEANVDAADAVMVAVHDWDLAGAKAAGLATAFVSRPGMPFASAYPPADYVATDFVALAATLGPPS